MKIIEDFKANYLDKEDSELFDKLQLVSIAKREEELFLP